MERVRIGDILVEAGLIDRAALERVIDYSLKQQMITKKPTVDELFNDVTRGLK